jgi:hypothetical protein
LNTVGATWPQRLPARSVFDIAVGSNVAFAAFQLTGGGTSTLYSINLTAGSAAPIGPIGGLTIRDIAVGRSTASNASTATIDFDGDGRHRLCPFSEARQANGSFIAALTVRTTRSRSGSNTDILTPGDYDGDGRTTLLSGERPAVRSMCSEARTAG